MTPEEFAKAVEAMTAIPPALRKRLMELAPHMTDDERVQTLASLKGSNDRIGGIVDTMTKELDEGIAAMDRYGKTTVAAKTQKIEEEEHKAADKILDDDSSHNPA